MTDEFPALTTWQQIGFIMATPDYNDGEPYLNEGDMNEVAVLLDTYKAERDTERDALRIALREVKDLLPLVFESSAAYDKIMVLLSK